MSIFYRSALVAAALTVAVCTASGTVRQLPEQAEEEAPELPAVVEIVPVPPAVSSAEPILQAIHETPEPADEPEAAPEIEADEQPEELPEAAPEKWREDVPLSAELQTALLAICEEAGVDPLLALGLIETESGFQTDIVSSTGDYGLCQLSHYYFPTDLSPTENMRAGINLLGQNLRKYGNTAAALTAYNRGHDDGTRSYAAVVLAKAEAWGYVAG